MTRIVPVPVCSINCIVQLFVLLIYLSYYCHLASSYIFAQKERELKRQEKDKLFAFANSFQTC